MPPSLPPRYRLEIRLGRDTDVEEWFATDLELHRPVLIRVIGPAAPDRRQDSFLAAVQQASRVSHTHVAAVYAADREKNSAYAVTEWTGGATLADQIRAGNTPSIAEFLSNAAGLADGLAALHHEEVTHGAIDPGAILYSGAHPAKLAGFGRPRRTASPEEDIKALGAALETSLTGRPAGILAPSQVIDALPPSVDDALRRAQEGLIKARQLADLIRSIPYSPPLTGSFRWSWRWLVPTGVLTLAAVLLVWLGSMLDTSPTSPLLAPAIPSPTITRPAPEPVAPSITVAPVPEEVWEPVVVTQVIDFDPLGDGQEHSRQVDSVVDGDLATAWRTERYYDPLPLLKDGVGLAFEVTGSPALLELIGLSEGTVFRIMWASSLLDIDHDGWEIITEEQAGSASIRFPLPSRRDGVWLLWLVDLPPEEDGYLTRLAEVSFHN